MRIAMRDAIRIDIRHNIHSVITPKCLIELPNCLRAIQILAQFTGHIG